MRVRQRGQNMEREPPCRQDPNPDSDSRSPRAIHQKANQSGTNNAKNQFLPQNTRYRGGPGHLFYWRTQNRGPNQRSQQMAEIQADITDQPYGEILAKSEERKAPS